MQLLLGGKISTAKKKKEFFLDFSPLPDLISVLTDLSLAL